MKVAAVLGVIVLIAIVITLGQEYYWWKNAPFKS